MHNSDHAAASSVPGDNSLATIRSDFDELARILTTGDALDGEQFGAIARARAAVARGTALLERLSKADGGPSAGQLG